MTKATRAPGHRGGRLLTAVSALSSGVLGWLLAHAFTDWLLAHAGHHHGNLAVHGHLHLPTVAVLVACLTGGSMLAVFVTALAGRRHGEARRLRPQRSAAHRSSMISTAAFVAAEFTEHAATGAHDVPPTGVLLLGCVVHALIGAASAVVWRHCLDQVLCLAARIRQAAPGDIAHRVPPAVRRAVSPRRTWQSLALAGRAPPVAAVCG